LQRNPLIAVVDDDPGMCDAIAGLLEVLDFDSARFSSAEDFLVGLALRRFDCLVSDIRMPGIDGCELGLRLQVVAPQLPVIFVSSSEEELGRARAMGVGGSAFMRKPLDPEEFKRQIDTVLLRI